MFTGLIEEVGRIEVRDPLEGGARFRIAAPGIAPAVRTGDSVAVDGACLTVVSPDPSGFVVEAIGTTLSRTLLGAAGPGDAVNLERAVAVGDRLGGHLVQGHVDGVGDVVAIERRGEHVLMGLRLPFAVAEVTVLHGSLAVNGVSMTVNARPSPDVAQIAVIPYTWGHTNLARLEVGSKVNLEGDMIGRFVVHYLKHVAFPGAGGGSRPPERDGA